MFHLVLFQPEIPPNTGNVIRLCANTGAALHLVRPLGFRLDARSVRRAGLDYRELAQLSVHDSLEACLATIGGNRWFAITTRGARGYHEVDYRAGDAFVLGPETRGLPSEVLERCGPEQCLRIPMQPGARSMNLANAAAVVLYEAWRQSGFALSPSRP